MKPWLSSLSALSHRRFTFVARPQHGPTRDNVQRRHFSTTRPWRLVKDEADGYDSPNARPAMELDHNVTQEEKDDFQRKLEEGKNRQIRTPWQREGSDTPPAAQQRSVGVMTKGQLLTTPSRMLKLIMPLPTKHTDGDRKVIEPLALLVHPQQPLSYLERLVQAELPYIKDKSGRERLPNVYFQAEDSMQGDVELSNPETASASKESETLGEEEKFDEEKLDKPDQFKADTGTEHTEKLLVRDRKTPEEAAQLRGGQGEGGVESYSGQGQEAPPGKGKERKFVRWSSSTDVGDFIRDAARGREFAVEIEGAPKEILVGAPSFNDRTYYLRMRLRKTSTQISDMAKVKEECDRFAHRGAQRVAMSGLGVLVGWWYLVYRLTFKTDLGWDVMEPVTYLVGLSTLVAGYVWFLYHNREVSYRSAMNLTISRRQSKLYNERGFDLRKWETLIDEGNTLRKEIKTVANEYDVEWDEMQDEKDEKVAKVLENERKRRKRKSKDEDGEKEDTHKGDQ